MNPGTLISLALVLFPAGPLPAQDKAPRLVAVTVDGPRAPAPLVDFNTDGGAGLGGPAPFRVAGPDLVELRSAHALPPFPRGHFALLANGDWLPLDPAGRIQLADERVQLDLAPPLRSKTGSRLTLSQSALALLALEAPEVADDPVQTWADLRKLRPARDLLLRRDAESLEGALTRVDERVHIRVGNRPSEVPIEQVAALVFSSDLRAHPRIRSHHAQLTLRNGARLTLMNLRVDAARGVIAGVSPYGATLQFPLEQLVHLEPRPGRITRLSELPLMSWRHTPFLDLTQTLGRDMTRSGRPLELGGAGHRHGLAMPCRGEAAFRLDAKYRWFEASLGVHPGAGQGTVRFGVRIDGKEVSLDGLGEQSADAAPRPVRIDVRGARTLTLIADFGRRGNVQAEALWGSARLIR